MGIGAWRWPPMPTADRYVDVPPEIVWEILVDLEVWPKWGPSVAGATVDGGVFGAGARGHVRTAVGVSLPFTVTDFEPGRRWAWAVAGVAATTHEVTAEESGCRVRFGVPWWATAYLPVCAVALSRIERLALASPK